MVNQHLICFSCLFMRKCRSERVQLQPPCRPNIDILIINKSQHRSFFPPNKNALLSCSVHFISLWLNISCANFSICHFPFMFDIAIKSVYLFIPLHWLHSAQCTHRGKHTQFVEKSHLNMDSKGRNSCSIMEFSYLRSLFALCSNNKPTTRLCASTIVPRNKNDIVQTANVFSSTPADIFYKYNYSKADRILKKISMKKKQRKPNKSELRIQVQLEKKVQWICLHTNDFRHKQKPIFVYGAISVAFYFHDDFYLHSP